MKLYELIGKIEVAIAKSSLLTMTLLVFVSALSRRLGKPMSWAVDVSTFLFAWSVFLGADAALRRDMLVSVDLFVDRLPEKVQKYINILNHIIIAIFLGLMVYYGAKLSVSTYSRKFAGLPNLSYSWVTISVPIGCALMLSTILLKLKKIFSDKEISE